ncbi:MAG: hypothetical protein JWQ15_2526 [Marmoricola sp.]|nr:hypothetical protein [Marmoricola sp.]
MPEPERSRLRPIAMVRILAVSAAALLVLAGCGSDERSGSVGAGPASSGSASPSGRPDPCATGSGFRSTANLAKVDVDGDGSADQVELGTARGCPALLVVHVSGGSLVTAVLPTRQPAVRTAFGVNLPGRQGSVVVTRQDHPRGGFQLRMWGLEDNELAELTVEGRPLVPFVVLDVDEHPMAVDCGDGGVVLTQAVAHEPAGVLFAWDIKRTSYAVDGNEVTAGRTEEIADNVLPRQLGARYPALVRHASFRSCRAAG